MACKNIFLNFNILFRGLYDTSNKTISVTNPNGLINNLITNVEGTATIFTHMCGEYTVNTDDIIKNTIVTIEVKEDT